MNYLSFFVGVLLLLLCTPLGFARLFTIVGELVVSPISAKNLDEEYLTLAYEEDCKNQKLDSCLQKTYGNTEHLNEQSLGSISSRYLQILLKISKFLGFSQLNFYFTQTTSSK